MKGANLEDMKLWATIAQKSSGVSVNRPQTILNSSKILTAVNHKVASARLVAALKNKKKT